MQPINLQSKYGPGCDRCVPEVGFYYGCKNPVCKNYSPPIVKGEVKSVFPEPKPALVSDTEVYEPKFLFGLYSDSSKRIRRFTAVKDIIGHTFRDLTNNKALVAPGKLVYAISLEGVMHVQPDKEPGKVKILGARRPVVVSMHDWDNNTRRWSELMHTRVQIT